MSIGYNAAGYARKLTRTSDGTVYGTIEAMDAWGHATLLSEANGVTVSGDYSPVTGNLYQICVCEKNNRGLTMVFRLMRAWC